MQQTNEVLEKNLEALAKRNKKLSELIRNHTASNVDFMEASSGDIIMIYDGFPMHDMQNPIEEAQKIYTHVKDTSYKSLNVIFGLGLGYLFKRATIECKGKIIVFEPSLDILRATLEVVDFSKELSLPNVWFVNDLIILRIIFMTNYFHGDYVGLQMLTAYKVKFPEQLEDITEGLQQMYKDSVINQATVLRKSKSWSLAALNNLFDIARFPNMLILRDQFTDIPAVIVSAGPSLEYALDKLKEIQDKVMIVSVGQALGALHKAGIKPHIVAVIENLNVSQQFEGISYINDLTVIVQPMTHRAIYELPVKRFLINFPLSDAISRWFGRNLSRDVSGLPNRGSVSFVAYYAAAKAGCNPLILTGQDLAYREGKMYASNTSYQELTYKVNENGQLDYKYDDETYQKIGKTLELSEEEFKARRQSMAADTITIKGWEGETLYTTNSYAVFLHNFTDIAERELPESGQKLINASEGGAFIKGLEHLPFEEALNESDLDHGIDINRRIDEICSEFTHSEKDLLELYNAIHEAMDNLQAAANISHEAIRISNNIQIELSKKEFDSVYIDNMVDELGKKDMQLIPIIKQLELINPFIQEELFDFSSNYNRESEAQDEENKIENLKANIDASLKLYKALITGSEQIRTILPQVLESNKDLLSTLNV
jgi:hypothetical protein